MEEVIQLPTLMNSEKAHGCSSCVFAMWLKTTVHFPFKQTVRKSELLMYSAFSGTIWEASLEFKEPKKNGNLLYRKLLTAINLEEN
jgi:hypothetical protein